MARKLGIVTGQWAAPDSWSKKKKTLSVCRRSGCQCSIFFASFPFLYFFLFFSIFFFFCWPLPHFSLFFFLYISFIYIYLSYGITKMAIEREKWPWKKKKGYIWSGPMLCNGTIFSIPTPCWWNIHDYIFRPLRENAHWPSRQMHSWNQNHMVYIRITSLV